MGEVNDVLGLRVDLDAFIFALRAIDPFTLVILDAMRGGRPGAPAELG